MGRFHRIDIEPGHLTHVGVLPKAHGVRPAGAAHSDDADSNAGHASLSGFRATTIYIQVQSSARSLRSRR